MGIEPLAHTNPRVPGDFADTFHIGGGWGAIFWVPISAAEAPDAVEWGGWPERWEAAIWIPSRYCEVQSLLHLD
jgi:hypothetical protein